MDRSQKEAAVQSFHAALKQSTSVIVGHYRGLTVTEMHSLRRQMRANGASTQVMKNRLAKIALKGTPYAHMEDLMQGPTVVAMSADPVAAAKVAQKFAKENEKFVIVGGALGERKLDKAGVQALASMPSLDELRAKLIGLISAPATRIATYTQEPAAKLARVLAAKGNKAA